LAKYCDEDQTAIEMKARSEDSVEQHPDCSVEMQRQDRAHLVKQLMADVSTAPLIP
jgi:hypothetical protein